MLNTPSELADEGSRLLTLHIGDGQPFTFAGGSVELGD
jgi:hypothetical protein